MKVAILMGSEKDSDKMQPAADVLAGFGISHEVHVMSAHRTPQRVAEFAAAARDNGYGAIICGAGKAAHLAGAVAAHSDILIAETAQEMTQRGPAATLVEFTGIGHAPTLQAADQIAAIEDFLNA